MSRIKFKIPDTIRKKYTGEKCSVCNCPVFLIDGAKVCGGCSIKKRNESYFNAIDDKCDPERLKDYNNDKYHKGKSALERSGGDSIKGMFK